MGEVRTGQFQHPGGGTGRVQRGGDLALVGGDLFGAVQIRLDEPAAPQRTEVRHYQDDDDDPCGGGRQAVQPGPGTGAAGIAAAGAAGAPPQAPTDGAERGGRALVAERGGQPFAGRHEPAGEQYRQTERDQRYRPGHRTQREPGGGCLRERAERRAQRRGVVIGVHAHRDRGTDEYQQDEVCLVAPSQQRRARQREHRYREARGDHPCGLGVVTRRSDPRAESVLAVEVPVAQAAQDLRRLRGARHRLERLAVGENVHPVAGLGDQTRDPPGRAQHDQYAGSDDHAQCGAEPDLPGPPQGEGQPQHRRQQHEDQTGRVAAADQRDGDTERGRPAPAVRPPGRAAAPGLAQPPDGDPEQPAKARVRQQDRRHSGLVLQDIGAQHVGGRGDEGGPVRPAKRPHAEQHAGARQEQHRAGPQPLGDPCGQTDEVDEPEEGALREEEADVLVGDRTHPDVRGPHDPRMTDQPLRVYVQICLGVDADPSGRREQQRQVGDRGQQRCGPRRQPPASQRRRLAAGGRAAAEPAGKSSPRMCRWCGQGHRSSPIVLVRLPVAGAAGRKTAARRRPGTAGPTVIAKRVRSILIRPRDASDQR